MNRNRMNLRMFDGGTADNNGRQYQKEFKGLLEAVFGVQSYFGDFFAACRSWAQTETQRKPSLQFTTTLIVRHTGEKNERDYH